MGTVAHLLKDTLYKYYTQPHKWGLSLSFLPKDILYHINLGPSQHHVYRNLLPIRNSLSNQDFPAAQKIPCDNWIQTLPDKLAATAVCR